MAACGRGEGGGVSADWRSSWPMSELYSGGGRNRGRDVYAIINLSASISTAETFLNTKAKCPLDVSEAAASPLLGGNLEHRQFFDFLTDVFFCFWRKIVRLFRPWEADQQLTTKNLRDIQI